MYLVEGNIGAGKSTFLHLVQKNLPELNVVFEPVDVWQAEECGKSLLQNFYSDTPRWAYTMESFTLINRIYENNKINSTKISLAERSIYSGYYCFAKNSYENSFMTQLEWNIYERWFKFLTSHANYQKPQGFIYLRTTPGNAYNRIIKRNRSAENLISFDYINQIHHKHEAFLLNQTHNKTNLVLSTPVLVLNADADFENDPQTLQQMLTQLKNFITCAALSE